MGIQLKRFALCSCVCFQISSQINKIGLQIILLLHGIIISNNNNKAESGQNEIILLFSKQKGLMGTTRYPIGSNNLN